MAEARLLREIAVYVDNHIRIVRNEQADGAVCSGSHDGSISDDVSIGSVQRRSQGSGIAGRPDCEETQCASADNRHVYRGRRGCARIATSFLNDTIGFDTRLSRAASRMEADGPWGKWGLHLRPTP